MKETIKSDSERHVNRSSLLLPPDISIAALGDWDAVEWDQGPGQPGSRVMGSVRVEVERADASVSIEDFMEIVISLLAHGLIKSVVPLSHHKGAGQ